MPKEHQLVTDRQTDGQTQARGQYCGCIASRGILRPEVLSKVPQIVGNVVKSSIFRKIREKCRRGQTGSSCVLWPTFGFIASRGS